MHMTFDEVKATQTAGSFLRLAGGRIQYLALIKMMYILDREALDKLGLPVTTDRYVSMRLGPVTSQMYDLVKVQGAPLRPSFWSTHIQRDGYDAILIANPETSELSPVEETLIQETYDRCRAKNGFDLADETHKHFAEWSDPGLTSKPIDIEDILSALSKSEAEVAHTESMMSIQNALSSMTRR